MQFERVISAYHQPPHTAHQSSSPSSSSAIDLYGGGGFYQVWVVHEVLHGDENEEATIFPDASIGGESKRINGGEELQRYREELLVKGGGEEHETRNLGREWREGEEYKRNLGQDGGGEEFKSITFRKVLVLCNEVARLYSFVLLLYIHHHHHHLLHIIFIVIFIVIKEISSIQLHFVV